ncbi:class I SAM-dependent methyltransferase [Streptosporangium sp. CA-135522]|uniref:class I SAM-dependent methyltransferase n=1 Tax=Streptosporangium sp. CA-135522 TaxID=3240072 RepID=UPI003D93FE7A
MRSVVVDSPAVVIRTLLDLIEVDRPTQFVDFGCGRGEVLLSVARKFPDLPCVGVDIDAHALEYARVRASAGNVTLIEGDVLDHAGMAEDLAYLYLGGALNQRLGHALLALGRCRSILAVRYPIAGAVAAARIPTADSTIFAYAPESSRGLVEWDAPATHVQVPDRAAYLLTRAVRVTAEGTLTLRCRALAGAFLRSYEFGLHPARPGVPVMCDMLLGSRGVLEVSVLLDGAVLTPSHLVVVTEGPPAERTVDEPAELERLITGRTSGRTRRDT